MSDEKMRAEFEVAAKTAQGLDVTRLPHGGYRSFATHQAWWAWQASRAALVVELPERHGGFSRIEESRMFTGDVVKAIEAAGVRVKQ